MADLPYPEDSCIRFWEDSSLDFSYCLEGEFSDISEPSTHLAPSLPLPSSFEEVGSPMLELDEPVLHKSDEAIPIECFYNVYDGILDNSGTPDVVVNSEANNVEDNDSYLDWDENSLAILPEPTWPPVDQSSCSFCQLMREIIHADGSCITKLEVHGRDGNVCHAVLLVQHSIDGLEPAIQREVIPFDVQDIESVKEFLLAYCRLRRQEGFIVLHDSLSAFYEAICAGMNEPEEPCPVSVSQYQGTDLDSTPRANDFTLTTMLEDSLPQLVASTSPGRPPKSGIAAQRERTGRLQISDLVNYFHLPITVAAKHLAICPTVLKKVCRRNGMRRWPHRKIKSIDRNLLNLERSLAEASREDMESITAEIEKLRKERARICAGNAAPT
ncbi:uncharacterized protein LOC116263252 [Nymphaea colorata]|nr:uncharacterized protein LOC116263252 [Nymphaea colorata]